MAAPCLPATGQILNRRRLRLIPLEAHPWARFKAGVWRTVKAETVVFDPSGEVIERARTESMTRFRRSDENVCLFEVDTNTEVFGKPVVETTEEVVVPIDPAGEGEVELLEPEVVTVSGRPHRAEVRRAKIVEKLGEKWMTVHLVGGNTPRILKRETKIIDPVKSIVKSITRTEVVAFDVERPVAGKNLPTWKVFTVHEHPAGKVETTEHHCEEVPGEVVAQNSLEFDARGVLKRWSTVELIAFGEDNPEREKGIGRRLRERRTS